MLDVRGDEASSGASLIVYDRKPGISANQLWYEDEVGLLRSKLNGYVVDTSCMFVNHLNDRDVNWWLHFAILV